MKFANKFNHIITALIITMSIPLFTMCQKSETDDSSAAAPAAEASAQLTRDQVEDKYKWDLTQLYTDQNAWEADYTEIESLVGTLGSFEGKLSKSSDMLLKCMKLTDKLNTKFTKLRMYASMGKDLDMTVAAKMDLFERANALGTKFAGAAAFINPEILSMPTAKLEGFIKSNKDLQLYKQKLGDISRLKAHTLSAKEEALLASAGPVESSFMNTYRIFTGTEFKFPTIKDDKGNDYALTNGSFIGALHSNDRAFRKRAYENFYTPFIAHNGTLAGLYNGAIKAKIFNAQARKYETTLEYALDQNCIPVEVYKNLVSTVNANIAPLHRWASVKKKMLGVESLHVYDTYVTLFPGSKKEYTYDEACEIVLKSLAPMGEEYVKEVKHSMDNRWIDVYETKNKRGGAYSSSSTSEAHPYILLNWNNQLDDMFTLTHEIGHNMHSMYTGKNQPEPYADYVIFLAEVASITNEFLLLDYLIENATTKDEKLSLIEKYLNNIKGTFFRQTRFAEFEMTLQGEIEKGAVYSPEKINKLFSKIYLKSLLSG
ncbi:MAG: oligoendopeptidase F family protein [Candidatus Kapabacteria bacterium]|jgi:oligoendopeptidase F|nr:oligoendopeptidase F family protein [Candidatus Kapabacteria bacterium]